MSNEAQALGVATKDGWLQHFPVPFFAVVMGLSGLVLALHAAEGALGLPHGVTLAAYGATLLAAAGDWRAVSGQSHAPPTGCGA